MAINHVFIQTRTGCNKNCSICPQDKAYKKFGDQEMSMELFEKILTDLGPEYKGSIDLYLQFEPLIDDRIFDFIEKAKEKCPLSVVAISSNAEELSIEKMEKLEASKIDKIFFHLTESTASAIEKVEYYKSFTKKPIFINFVMTNKNKDNDIKADYRYWASNRLGSVDVDVSGPSRFAGCNPSLQLAIVATGQVIQCCNDWMREVSLGDANKDDISKIIPTKHKICARCK
jgi:hypothetical protein